MKDRFRFRVWCVNKNQWETGKVYLDNEGRIYDDFHRVKEETHIINFCTGLKDKNGKLIYEGDLLRYPPKNEYEQENYACLEVFFHDNDCCDNHIGFQLGRVHFQGCLCGMSFGSKYKFIPENANEMVVIGNIYENKDLLKEQK